MLSNCASHLRDAEESYFDHMRFAVGVGLILLAAGLACVVHGLVPGCCTKTASRTVGELGRLFHERDRLSAVLAEASGALTMAGLVVLTLPAFAMLLIAPPNPLSTAISLLSLTIPAAFLWTNPQLEAID